MTRPRSHTPILMAFCAAALAAGAFSAEDPEQALALTTRAGSRLFGMLGAGQPFTLRGAKISTRIDWSTVARLQLGERVDLNRENDARNALGDLLSERYEVRQKAQQQLRELGRAALRPLREVLAAPDPELARQARSLLAELGELSALQTSGDVLELKDGTSLRGELAPGSLRFRTRWGSWTVPLDAVDSLEPVDAGRIAVAELVPASTPPKPFSPGKRAVAEPLQPWQPPLENIPGGTREYFRSMTRIDCDHVVTLQPDGRPRREELKAGDDLSSAYASRGLLLKQPEEAGKPVCAELQLNSLSGGMGLRVESGKALWLQIVQPGSHHPEKSPEGEPAGAHIVGAHVGLSAPRSVGLAAYDKAGRLLGQVYNEGVNDLEGVDAADRRTELLAVRSSVPVSRVRFFSLGEIKPGEGKELAALRIDDIFVDWIVSADRSPDLFGITLRSGERLCGTLQEADWQKGLKLQAEFLPAGAPALPLSCDDILIFDTPARRSEQPADTKRQRLVIGNQHAVLLQNGEKFHACFVKLDDKEALFLMSGQVEFRLPRALLRKIDLQPAFDPQTGRATAAIAAEEKPGVEFRRRERKSKDAIDPAAPVPDEPEEPAAKEEPGKKSDLLQQRQELKRMDDAKIVEADILSGDLTVDDGGGDWTIGLAPVKALVFPPDAEAAAEQPGFREWQIVLRDRSRFDVVPMAISNETLTVQLARGVVQMPFSVFESLQRKK